MTVQVLWVLFNSTRNTLAECGISNLNYALINLAI